jgi:hypothetical protein
VLELRETAGAMHQVDRRAPALTEVRFGFDRTMLYVRVDGQHAMTNLLADGHELSLKFLTPTGLRFSVSRGADGPTHGFWDRLPDPPYWKPRGPGQSRAVAGTVVEMAVALADLGVQASGTVAFFVALYDRRGSELERHPRLRALELVVPDATFEARHWRA